MTYLAYCGFDCTKCPIFIATKDNNKNELKNIKHRLEKNNHERMTIEQIKCKGCKSNIIYKYCKECKLRQCAVSKGVITCALCDFKKCSEVEKIYQYNKKIFEQLTKLRENKYNA